MPTLKLMISHAGEDKIIAQAWRSLLGNLYGNMRGIWFSNDPGGAFDGYQPFAIQIEHNIRKASAILTIQTPYSVHKPWVVWEAGLAKGAKKRTFIATYGVKRGALGNPLDGMDQNDGLSRRSVASLAVLLGTVTKQSPFTEDMFASAWDIYVRTIQQGTDSLPVIPTVQYDKRIVLRMPATVAATERDPDKIMKDVTVVNVNDGLTLFGYNNSMASVAWARFYSDLEEQDKTRKWPGSASGWATALDDVIHLVLGDKLGEAESLPLYLDEGRDIAYRPSISSRVQNNEYVDIVVTFNQLPEEISKRPPGRCGILSHLLDFCRMFRWGVLQREAFEQLFSGELTKTEAAQAYIDFLRALTNIRIDFQNRGLRQGDILDAFPEGLHEHVSTLLRDYYRVMDSLNPRLNPTESHMADSYHNLLRLNRNFYIAVYESFGQCLQRLSSGD